MSKDLKKEVVGIGLGGLFLFLLLSLLSYYPFDPSLNTVASGPARNLCGKAGSYIADLLIQLFGMKAYLTVLVSLFFALF